MIHILPEAFKSQEVNSNIAAFIFISAIVAFILIERLFTCCGVTHNHEEDSEQEQNHDERRVGNVSDSLNKIQNAEIVESGEVIDAGRLRNGETKKPSENSK